MNQDETILRENIYKLVKLVNKRKTDELSEARQLIRKLINYELKELIDEARVPDVDPTPNKSTGINVLEELLKKIVPVLQVDYKSLTTNLQQRESFRAHIINAVINTLTPAKINNQSESPQELDEEIDIQIGDEEDDKFIDIRTNAEKKAEEEADQPDEREDFASGVTGDETGRNMAYNCFKKIESNIIDSYELLSDPEDQELFYDYLIANLKLYFDKFEGELDESVPEPTNQAYDSAKEEVPAEDTGEELEFEL